jgi:hypothetical protein
MSDPLRELTSAIQRIFAEPLSLGLYEESFALLRHMEDRLAKAQSRKWVPRSANRFAIVPLFLLLRGLGQMIESLGRPYFAIASIAVLGLALAPNLPGEMAVAGERIATALGVLVLAFYLFAAPSTYCTSGLNAKHVGAVKDRLVQSKAESEARLELITRNLKLFEERIKRRLATYRWILGAAWAIYFAPALAQLSGIGAEVTGTNRAMPEASIVALVLVFLVFDAYGRGVDILFRALEFGCNEHLAILKRAHEGNVGQA